MPILDPCRRVPAGLQISELNSSLLSLRFRSVDNRTKTAAGTKDSDESAPTFQPEIRVPLRKSIPASRYDGRATDVWDLCRTDACGASYPHRRARAGTRLSSQAECLQTWW